jgi:hypothetical protein
LPVSLVSAGGAVPRRPAAYCRTPEHSTPGQEEDDKESRRAWPGTPVAKSAPAIGAGLEKTPHRRAATGSQSRENRSEVARANRHELSQSLRLAALSGHAVRYKKSDNTLKPSDRHADRRGSQTAIGDQSPEKENSHPPFPPTTPTLSRNRLLRPRGVTVEAGAGNRRPPQPAAGGVLTPPAPNCGGCRSPSPHDSPTRAKFPSFVFYLICFDFMTPPSPWL